MIARNRVENGPAIYRFVPRPAQHVLIRSYVHEDILVTPAICYSLPTTYRRCITAYLRYIDDETYRHDISLLWGRIDCKLRTLTAVSRDHMTSDSVRHSAHARPGRCMLIATECFKSWCGSGLRSFHELIIIEGDKNASPVMVRPFMVMSATQSLVLSGRGRWPLPEQMP